MICISQLALSNYGSISWHVCVFHLALMYAHGFRHSLALAIRPLATCSKTLIHVVRHIS